MKDMKLPILTLLTAIMLSNAIFAAATTTNKNVDLRDIAASLDLQGVAILDANVEKLSDLGSLNILFIDDKWLQVQRDNDRIQEIRSAILHGVPVFIFGGDTNLIYGLADATIKETVNQPTIASGVYFNGNGYSFLFIGGTSITESSIKDGYNWATTKLSDSLAEEMSILSAPEAVWYSIAQFTYYYEWEPYGKLNLIREWFKLKYDQSSTYDWYSIVMTTQSVPGHVAWSNNWRTADLWNWIDADYHGYSNTLIKYGPYQTIGQTTVTYTIGVVAGEQGAAATASISRTYTVQDIEVFDQSDFSLQLAKWWHNVNERTNAGLYTCTIEPGATIRTPPSLTETESFYQAQYVQPNWYWDWLWPDVWTSPQVYITTTVDYNFTPDTPLTPAGPTSGVKYTSYTYSTSTYDPDGDNVQYQFDWKDGTTTWTGWISSETTAFASHSWSVGGTYSIIVRAKDIDGAYSSWSMVLAVTIINNAPNTPSTPSGPTSGYTYTTYTYTTSATDSDGDNVRYKFDWGDGTTTTTGWYASGATASASHYWTSTGTKYVKVQAQDTDGAWSSWSSTLTVTISSGDGCPYISVWNGTLYVLDNNVLPASEKNARTLNGTDVKDSYRLEQTPVRDAGKFWFLLSEFEHEHSYIDQVKLKAVDHLSDIQVAVASDGEILTYKNPAAPVSAIDNHGNDRLSEIRRIDGNVSDPTTYFYGQPGDSLTLNFGQVGSDIAKLIMRVDMIKVKECIEVQVLNEEGTWQSVDTVLPRDYWSTVGVNLSSYVVEGRDLMVRLLWKEPHRLDFAGLDTTPQATTSIKSGVLVSATHSVKGDVTSSLRYSDDNYAELLLGEGIELEFILPRQTMEARDYIIMFEGHYFTITG